MKRKWYISWVLLLFCTMIMQGQVHSLSVLPNDSLQVITTDSVPVVEIDSMVTKTVTESPELTENNRIEPQLEDSIETVALTSDRFFAPKSIFKPNPRKAILYSAILPGMGQIYNRNYWKLPILYGGFIGLAYAINWNQGFYKLYFDAYRSIIDNDPNTVDWHNVLPYGQNPGSIDENWFANVLKDRKDYFRYYRDFCIIGAVALYGLAIVDAYVDAQLFDFDMSPDLSMKIAPTIMNQKQSSLVADSYGILFSFNF